MKLASGVGGQQPVAHLQLLVQPVGDTTPLHLFDADAVTLRVIRRRAQGIAPLDPLVFDIEADGQMLARQVVGQGLAIGGFEPEGLQIPRQRFAGHADQLPLLRRGGGIGDGALTLQHFYLAACLNPPLVQRHQILAEVDLAILATAVAGKGGQRFFQGVETIGACFHRGHDAAAAGLDHLEFHLTDADAHPTVLLEGLGIACYQIGAELAHLVQGIGAQIEIFKGSLAYQQQRITVCKADPGAGLFTKAI